jgi:AraC-like DNA-binding protein
MAQGGILAFGDPDGYAAAFGDSRIDLTITAAGDFRAQLTWLHLKYIRVYRCCENLTRIGYISLSPEPTFLSFPIGAASAVSAGVSVRNGDVVFHSRGERIHQRFDGVCQWGLLTLSAEHFARCSKALTGQPILSPLASKVIRPSRTEQSRFRSLFMHACRLAESGKITELPEVARPLEDELLHTIVHCLVGHEADETPRASRHHADVMVRFEEALCKYVDQKPSMPRLCADIGVAERTLRMCCAEFLGLSPTRYLLLRRLNKARSALRRADSSTTSVAEIARDHHFLELGRFAVTYRIAFGESPSVTLHRDPRA